MTPPPEHVRALLGAYALGHLSADEAEMVRAHLEGCEACRTEAEELAAVAAVLPLADPERLGAPAEPPDDLLGGILDRIDDERDVQRRSRRRSVALRTGVAAALALVVVGVALIALPEDEGDQGQLVAMASSVPGAEGEAVVHRDPASTWVELNTSGLPAGETYAVWLEEIETGEREPAGTFVGVEGDLYISLYSTLPRENASAIGVSDEDGQVVMQADLLAPAPE